ncbi:hypothetical protein GQ44DRAFT_492340 [Phaeosphaeriaceae sp. PMI808]|nr:hypothetical protein GQ44DRAFT_492340 [Phaeosphaeriaceae sp. PMI808]
MNPLVSSPNEIMTTQGEFEDPYWQTIQAQKRTIEGYQIASEGFRYQRVHDSPCILTMPPLCVHNGSGARQRTPDTVLSAYLNNGYPCDVLLEEQRKPDNKQRTKSREYLILNGRQFLIFGIPKDYLFGFESRDRLLQPCDIWILRHLNE